MNKLERLFLTRDFMGDPRRGGSARDYEPYTGGMNEKDVLGELRIKEGYKAELAKIVNQAGFAPRDAAMELIRRFTVDNPTAPRKPFAIALRNRVAKLLHLSTPQDLKRLRYYTAVGKKEVSPLDFFHGVDAWIELLDTDTDIKSVVTIDATIRGNKDDAKADLLVKNLPDVTKDNVMFDIMVNQFAERTAHLFGIDPVKEKPPVTVTKT
ncbi:MAG: hypothetical protein AAB664_02980, partial [Patescibacteria group bacterium]